MTEADFKREATEFLALSRQLYGKATQLSRADQAFCRETGYLNAQGKPTRLVQKHLKNLKQRLSFSIVEMENLTSDRRRKPR